MKKYLVMMLCAGMLFAATGCGDEKKEEKSDSNTDTKQPENNKGNEKEKNQVLKCSSSLEDIMDMSFVFTYDKDGKTIESMNYVMEVNVEDELEELKELTEEEIENEICGSEDFDSDAVKSCKAKLNGNKVVANIEFDVEKMTEDSDEFEFNKKTPIEELKDIIADNEYTTCEIEK